MNLRRSEAFLADVELQFQWYAEHAGWDIAERYLATVESICALLKRQPLLGPAVNFRHPRLAAWRYFVVFRPFQRHLLFYQISDSEVTMRRALHGHVHLSKRLLDPPDGG